MLDTQEVLLFFLAIGYIKIDKTSWTNSKQVIEKRK